MYRTDVDDHWLPVVGSERTRGELFVEQVENQTFASPFARMISSDFENRCIELMTIPPDAILRT